MAAHDAIQRDVHATTTSSGWSTKRIATTALFCAVAAICTLFMEFPLLPGLTFLRYDPSAIVALVAGFAYGPATGAVVSVLPYLVHLANESGFYGMVMAIIATLSLVLPASLVYRRWHSFRGAVAGLLVGGVVCLVCCIGANLIVTPLYMATTLETVVAMIVPALLPFNLLKIGINCVMTMLVYKPLSRALES
jgi:riboflavin transporter FmnP